MCVCACLRVCVFVCRRTFGRRPTRLVGVMIVGVVAARRQRAFLCK